MATDVYAPGVTFDGPLILTGNGACCPGRKSVASWEKGPEARLDPRARPAGRKETFPCKLVIA
ncbi:MAG TPA: hypothetical protein DD490_05615 [Acidobacteria bacterium]|nr:hypothetical protein [Acidobacteriota bacterium]